MRLITPDEERTPLLLPELRNSCHSAVLLTAPVRVRVSTVVEERTFPALRPVELPAVMPLRVFSADLLVVTPLRTLPVVTAPLRFDVVLAPVTSVLPLLPDITAERREELLLEPVALYRSELRARRFAWS